MDPTSLYLVPLKNWIDILSGIALLIGGVLASSWAYTKFVLERGFLPPTDFYVDCKKLGSERDVHLLELIIHIKNLGTSALVISNLRIVDIRYLTFEDNDIKYFNREDILQGTIDGAEKIDKVAAEKINKITESKKGLRRKEEIEKEERRKDEDKIRMLRKQTARLGRLVFPQSLMTRLDT